MKTVGIIGGVGPESTIEYYRGIIATYREQKNDGNYPSIIINSINLKDMVDFITSDRLDQAAETLALEWRKERDPELRRELVHEGEALPVRDIAHPARADGQGNAREFTHHADIARPAPRLRIDAHVGIIQQGSRPQRRRRRIPQRHMKKVPEQVLVVGAQRANAQSAGVHSSQVSTMIGMALAMDAARKRKALARPTEDYHVVAEMS